MKGIHMARVIATKNMAGMVAMEVTVGMDMANKERTTLS